MPMANCPGPLLLTRFGRPEPHAPSNLNLRHASLIQLQRDHDLSCKRGRESVDLLPHPLRKLHGRPLRLAPTGAIHALSVAHTTHTPGHPNRAARSSVAFPSLETASRAGNCPRAALQGSRSFSPSRWAPLSHPPPRNAPSEPHHADHEYKDSP